MKSFFTSVLLFFAGIILFAQEVDLTALAKGELVYTAVLRDSTSEVSGYIMFYDQGPKRTDKRPFEYVVLDPDLKEKARGQYTEMNSSGMKSVFYGLVNIGDDIIFSKYLRNNYRVQITFSQTISLKDNTVSKPFMFDDDHFVDLPEISRELKLNLRADNQLAIINPISGKEFQGFFIADVQKGEGKSYQNKDLRVYNLDRKLMWSYTFNPDPKRTDFYEFDIRDVHDGLMIGVKTHQFGSALSPEINQEVVGLDVLTGKIKISYSINDDIKTKFYHQLNIRYLNDKIHIVGPYIQYGLLLRPWKHTYGVYGILLDKNGHELSKEYFAWDKIAKDLNLNEFGMDDQQFFLWPDKFFFFKDQSFSFLGQKIKHADTDKVTSDYHLFNFNAQNKFVNSTIIDKDRSRAFGNGYLFSQYNKNQSGVTFFLRNYEKRYKGNNSTWILDVNQLKDAELSSKEFSIAGSGFQTIPIAAKSGYILLDEYNENKKIDRLRLLKVD